MEIDEPLATDSLTIEINANDPASVAEAFRCVIDQTNIMRRESQMFALLCGVAIGYAERDSNTRVVSSMLIKLLRGCPEEFSGPMSSALLQGIEAGHVPPTGGDGGSRIVELFKKAA